MDYYEQAESIKRSEMHQNEGNLVKAHSMVEENFINNIDRGFQKALLQGRAPKPKTPQTSSM